MIVKNYQTMEINRLGRSIFIKLENMVSYVSCVIPNGTFGIHRPKLWATIKMKPASF